MTQLQAVFVEFTIFLSISTLGLTMQCIELLYGHVEAKAKGMALWKGKKTANRKMSHMKNKHIKVVLFFILLIQYLYSF